MIDIFDELKVSWDDNTCELYSYEVLLESYHSDNKYHMTLDTIFDVLIVSCAI